MRITISNLLGKNINIIKKPQKLLLHACKEVCSEVNTEKTKYTFMSHYHATGEKNNIKVAD
jgi:hypothetical protein